MKNILFPLLLFCSGIVFCASPEIPEQLAPEVREYFRKDPQLFRGAADKATYKKAIDEFLLK